MRILKNLHKSPVPAWIAALVLLAIVVVLVCCSATRAFAYPEKVERWRPRVVKSLKGHHIYSEWRVERTLRIIEGESGGSAGCRTGTCWGLVQMNSQWSWWKHIRRGHYRTLKRHGSHYLGHRRVSDWRLCGACELHRMTHVWKHSTSKVKQHWSATYY